MARFEIGDRVLVTHANAAYAAWVSQMYNYVGQQGVVRTNGPNPLVEFNDDHRYFFPDNCLEIIMANDPKEDLAPGSDLAALFYGGGL